MSCLSIHCLLLLVISCLLSISCPHAQLSLWLSHPLLPCLRLKYLIYYIHLLLKFLTDLAVWSSLLFFFWGGRHLWLTFQTHLVWQMESCLFPTVPSFVFSPLKSVTRLLPVAITDQSQVKSYICNFHIFGAKISWCYQHTVLIGKCNRMTDF